MDPNLKIALIAGSSAIIGGVITAIVAPHINWGIEKRRERLSYRRKLIADARTMIIDVARADGGLVELLEQREAFHAIKGHLPQSVIGEIYNQRTFMVGSTIGAGLSYLSDELSKLEKKWKLV